MVCEGNFHGRTITIISASTDKDARADYGPYTPGIEIIPYNDPQALASILEAKGNLIAGFLVEPIQGEAGVNVPDEGYLKACYELCENTTSFSLPMRFRQALPVQVKTMLRP